MNYETISLAVTLFAACTMLTLATHGLAQTAATGSGRAYPTKPVRIVVPFAAGGGTPEDLAAHLKSETVRFADIIRKGNITLQ